MVWTTPIWAVDAAFCDTLGRHCVGIFDHNGVARFFVCPSWITTQQTAELYGIWMVIKLVVRMGLSVVTLLEDNVAVIWQVLKLSVRAACTAQARILRALVHWIRSTDLVVHVVYVPTDIQPADPISRMHRDWGGSLALAEQQANLIYTQMLKSKGRTKYKGCIYI